MDEINARLLALEAEVSAMHLFIGALINAHPDPSALAVQIERFQRTYEAFAANSPHPDAVFQSALKQFEAVLNSLNERRPR